MCLDREATPELSLPSHWVRDFYHASLCLEMQENQEALSRLQVGRHSAWLWVSWVLLRQLAAALRSMGLLDLVWAGGLLICAARFCWKMLMVNSLHLPVSRPVRCHADARVPGDGSAQRCFCLACARHHGFACRTGRGY